MPFQLYGNAEGQILVVVVLLEVFLIVRLRVIIESHPATLVNVIL